MSRIEPVVYLFPSVDLEDRTLTGGQIDLRFKALVYPRNDPFVIWTGHHGSLRLAADEVDVDDASAYKVAASVTALSVDDLTAEVSFDTWQSTHERVVISSSSSGQLADHDDQQGHNQ
jgi:hypothetical protein